MSEAEDGGPHERLVGRLRNVAAWHTPGGPTPKERFCKMTACLNAVAELDRLRAERDALALLLGECADDLETEIHCRLSGDKATLRLELPHRAKRKLRELGLLTPNA